MKISQMKRHIGQSLWGRMQSFCVLMESRCVTISAHHCVTSQEAPLSLSVQSFYQGFSP